MRNNCPDPIYSHPVPSQFLQLSNLTHPINQHHLFLVLKSLIKTKIKATLPESDNHSDMEDVNSPLTDSQLEEALNQPLNVPVLEPARFKIQYSKGSKTHYFSHKGETMITTPPIFSTVDDNAVSKKAAKWSNKMCYLIPYWLKEEISEMDMTVHFHNVHTGIQLIPC